MNKTRLRILLSGMGPGSTGSPPGVLHAHHGRRRWGALVTVCLAVTVIVMDGSIVNVALPTLVRAIEGTSNSRLQWIVDAYILSFAVLLLTSGSSADRFGRRRLLVTGLLVFGGVSFGAAFAENAMELIAWRGLMGVGAALIFPATLAILHDAFPEPRLRRMAIALWAGCSGLGVAVGPVAGGWIITHAHWGWIFLINVPLIAITALGALLWIRESKDADPRHFDPLGNALVIAGLGSLVWALIEGPEWGWGSASILVALALSAALLGSFVAWESRTDGPMLDVRLFRSTRFTGGCLAITASFFGLFGFVFMVTQYFQFIHGYDALEAGIRTLPFAGFIVAGSLLSERTASLWGPRWLSPAGLLLMAAGFLLVSRDTEHTAYKALVIQMGFLGVGLGLVNASATDAIMGSLPANKSGLGSSVNDTVREIGGTLGIAVMGSLFNSMYRAHIDSGFLGAPLPESAIDSLRDSVGSAAIVIERIAQAAGANAALAVRTPVQDAFMNGFRGSSLLAAITTMLGALGVLSLLSMPLSSTEAMPFRRSRR